MRRLSGRTILLIVVGLLLLAVVPALFTLQVTLDVPGPKPKTLVDMTRR